MWEVYGEGGGQFNSLKDARECAKEFSKVGNDYDGYTGEPGEVSIWKDGTLYFTYKNGKVLFDGWSLKKNYYTVLNLQTRENEQIVTNQSNLQVGHVYNLADGRKVKIKRVGKIKPEELPKEENDENIYIDDHGYKVKINYGEDGETSITNSDVEVTKSLNNNQRRLFEAFRTHSELNRNLFDLDGGENKMHNDVRIRLCEIADMFVESIQEDNVPIKVLDYWLVGSNAAYNYTPDSDIDIHVIVDMEDVFVNPYLLRLLYDYIKSNFNNKYDIMVKGYGVELYLEDVKTSSVTNGIYSLKQDKWIKVPEPREDKNYYVEETELYNDIYKQFIDLEDFDAEKFLDDLYILRKESLASEGEFGLGNLIFKQFRNNGYIDELKEMKYRFKSDELTLESFSQLTEDENTTVGLDRELDIPQKQKNKVNNSKNIKNKFSSSGVGGDDTTPLKKEYDKVYSKGDDNSDACGYTVFVVAYLYNNGKKYDTQELYLTFKSNNQNESKSYYMKNYFGRWYKGNRFKQNVKYVSLQSPKDNSGVYMKLGRVLDVYKSTINPTVFSKYEDTTKINNSSNSWWNK